MRPANTVISFYAAMFVLPALLVAVTCFAAARLPRRGGQGGVERDVEGDG